MTLARLNKAPFIWFGIEKTFVVRTIEVISALQMWAGETSKAKGFRDLGTTFGDRIALIHSELSEALEEFRAGRVDTWFQDDGKPEGVPIEMADAVIRILDMADWLDIDLGAAIGVLW